MAFRITLLSLALIATCTSAMQLVCPPANVCYAIDESGSITSAQFTQQTNALVSITNAFDVLAGGSTYAAAGFDDVSTVVSQPTTDLPTFIQRLRSNTQSGGATSSGSGLNRCRDLLINQPEPRIIVLITDGGDNRDPRGTAVHQGIKDQGFSIATVGVGNGAQDNILQNTIASSPNLFTKVDDFSAFPAAINTIVESLCMAVTPTPSVSATPSASMSATPSVSPTPSTSMSPSPSANPAFDDCSACKLGSECKSGVCYKHRCGSDHQQVKGGCLIKKNVCDQCMLDWQCKSRKCWEGKCGYRWEQSRDGCVSQKKFICKSCNDAHECIAAVCERYRCGTRRQQILKGCGW